MALALRHRFDLGACASTPAALAHLAANDTTPVALLTRHATGDWGELDRDDWLENERSIVRGWRILSSYPIGDAVVWVITEADRSRTTMFMCEEY